MAPESEFWSKAIRGRCLIRWTLISTKALERSYPSHDTGSWPNKTQEGWRNRRCLDNELNAEPFNPCWKYSATPHAGLSPHCWIESARDGHNGCTTSCGQRSEVNEEFTHQGVRTESSRSLEPPNSRCGQLIFTRMKAHTSIAGSRSIRHLDYAPATLFR